MDEPNVISLAQRSTYGHTPSMPHVPIRFVIAGAGPRANGVEGHCLYLHFRVTDEPPASTTEFLDRSS
jgi:hypothetical protein